MQLYTYFRSSAAYRVRIALNLKGLTAEHIPVHLLKDGGQQHGESYRSLNPQELVPTLVDGPHALTQSLAICEYLDECHPQPPLLPGDAAQRAHIRAIALSIACDIHPVNNLRILQYLSNTLQVSDAQKTDWYLHWLRLGLDALETQIAQQAGRCCVGDHPTLADLCLIPQLYNARRYQLDPAQHWPTLARIEQHCLSLPAFHDAAPEQQADAA
ncbi:maleylacetoacetate isomerase [Leeia sp.]|uniref:maleylacetoacetate isomerase n=1 Tax=Leeia sp. TaxID=2884678 RepID=UPI0035AFB522